MKQSDPFTVGQLAILHGVLHDSTALFGDRLVRGAALVAVYTRSRWMGMQHTDEVLMDPDPKDPVFVTIPVKDKIKKNRVRYLRCPVILLHEVVHHVASTDQFHVDSQELQEFWRLWSLHKPHHPAAAQGLHWPLGLEVMMQSTAWLAAKLSLSA